LSLRFFYSVLGLTGFAFLHVFFFAGALFI